MDIVILSEYLLNPIFNKLWDNENDLVRCSRVNKYWYSIINELINIKYNLKYLNSKYSISEYYAPCLELINLINDLIIFDKICEFNNYIKYLILKCVNSNIINAINIEGFISACSNNKPYLIPKFYDKIDTKNIHKIYRNITFILNVAFRVACKNGHFNVIKVLINYGANDFKTGYIEAFNNKHSYISNFLAKIEPQLLN